MNRVNGVVKMYFRDRWSLLFLPWIIVGSSFLVNLVIAGFLDEPLYTGGLSSIYVYMMVMGIVSLAQTFPFAIGMSVRRKDFFAGTLIVQVVIGLAIAIVLLLLASLENKGIEGWGVGLHFFHLQYISEGSLLHQLWFNFSIMLHMIVSGFTIASIFRRFGKTGLYVFFIVLMLLLTIGGFLITYNEWWDNIGRWLETNPPSAAVLATWCLPVTIVYWLVSYAMLRRATI